GHRDEALARDARRDGGRRGRRRAVPRGPDRERAPAPRRRAARAGGGALPADGDDGEPDRAARPDDAGLVMRGVESENGRVTPEHIAAEEPHRLGPGGIVVLENTHRSSGGRVYPVDELQATIDAARERGLKVHLDGARLFNAAVAAGLPPAEWARRADSVTVCFSKGLGCPLGAVLAGPAELIERAWEGKYLFGGALRQSGVVAAAMLYALDHNVERLAEDHARAARLADALGLESET